MDTDMNLQDAIKAAITAFDASASAIDKAKAAGAIFVTLEERGAKTKVAQAIVEKKGVSLKTAKNFISMCIKAHQTNADTVRMASSKAAPKSGAKKRFNAAASAERIRTTLGDDKAEKIARKILADLGYTFSE